MTVKTIPLIRRGDTIRAEWLNQLVRTVNTNTRLLRQQSGQGLSDFYRTAPQSVGGGGGGVSMPTSITFTATSRGSATQTITDDNGDQITWYQATSFVMTASAAGQSYVWTFGYPTGV